MTERLVLGGVYVPPRLVSTTLAIPSTTAVEPTIFTSPGMRTLGQQVAPPSISKKEYSETTLLVSVGVAFVFGVGVGAFLIGSRSGFTP